jgi:hypothetical protein
MPVRVEPQREHRRPVEEEDVENCDVTTVKRRCESWSDCDLSAGKRTGPCTPVCPGLPRPGTRTLLARSLGLIGAMSARHLLRHQTLQQEAAWNVACASTRSGLARTLHPAKNFVSCSRLRGSCAPDTRRPTTVYGQVLR